MHLPTYLLLMVLAAVYGVVQMIQQWAMNRTLFWVAVFVLITNIVVTVAQFRDDEGWELKWMLFHSIPMGLLCVSLMQSSLELSNHALAMAEIAPIPSPITGTSEEFGEAAARHVYSMCFPIIARALAKVVGFASEQFRNL